MMSPDELSPVVSSILIEVHQSGAVKVSGHVQDKQYALNLIEAARDAIISYHNKSIIIPNAGI